MAGPGNPVAKKKKAAAKKKAQKTISSFKKFSKGVRERAKDDMKAKKVYRGEQLT